MEGGDGGESEGLTMELLSAATCPWKRKRREGGRRAEKKM